METEAGEDQNKSLSPQQGRTTELRAHVVCDCSQTVSVQAQSGRGVPMPDSGPIDSSELLGEEKQFSLRMCPKQVNQTCLIVTAAAAETYTMKLEEVGKMGDEPGGVSKGREDECDQIHGMGV